MYKQQTQKKKLCTREQRFYEQREGITRSEYECLQVATNLLI